MGVSTNALLIFGFDFHDSDSDGDYRFGEEGWEEFYAAKKGVVDDSELFNKEGNYAVPEGAERNRREKLHDIYYDKKQKLAKKAGVEIDCHCSTDYPIYFVSLRSYSASRGFPTKIDISKIDDVTQDEIAKLKEFCEIMEIKWKKPHWYLASYWG